MAITATRLLPLKIDHRLKSVDRSAAMGARERRAGGGFVYQVLLGAEPPSDNGVAAQQLRPPRRTGDRCPRHWTHQHGGNKLDARASNIVTSRFSALCAETALQPCFHEIPLTGRCAAG